MSSKELNVLDAVRARARNSDAVWNDAKERERKKRLSAYIDEASAHSRQQATTSTAEDDFVLDVVRKRAALTNQEEGQPQQDGPPPPALRRQQERPARPGAFAEGRGRSSRGQRRAKASLAYPVDEGFHFRDDPTQGTTTTEIPEGTTNDASEREDAASKSQVHPRNKKIAVAAILFLVIGVVGAVVAVTLLGKESSSNPTQEEASQAPAMDSPVSLEQVFLDPSVLPDTTIAAIHSVKSNNPQQQALRWLANDPNLDLYSVEQKVQRLALATIYYATNGPSWFEDWAAISNPWLDYESHECRWYSLAQAGVGPELCAGNMTLDRYQHMDYTSLVLSGGYQGYSPALKGVLPPEMGLLTALENLDLGHQQLKGSIPTELVQLSSTLKTIVLEASFFTGTIPDSFFEFASVLRLDRNPRFEKSTIPTTVGLNTDLTVLSLIETNQIGTIPTELFQAPYLQQLFLNENSMTGTLPTEVGLLESSLKDIDLSSNRFTGSIPSQVGLLDRLEYLYLDKNQLKGTLATQLGDLESLRQFGVFFNHISGPIPSEMGSWKAISYLTVGKNKLTGTFPTSLFNLSKLETLDVGHNNIGGPFPLEIISATSGIATWPKLIYLGVNNNQMTGTIPSELGLLVSLQKLWLAENEFEFSVPSELGVLKALQELQLEATDVTGLVPEEICSLPLESFHVDCNRIECPPACRCVCGY